MIALEEGNDEVGADLELGEDFDVAVAESGVMDIGYVLDAACLVVDGELVAEAVVVDGLGDRAIKFRVYVFRYKFAVVPVGIGVEAEHADAIGLQKLADFGGGGFEEGFEVEGLAKSTDDAEEGLLALDLVLGDRMCLFKGLNLATEDLLDLLEGRLIST